MANAANGTSAIKISSNGIWQHDNPLEYSFPLLVVQITLVLLLSRALGLILKPLRQPKVVAEILGGILLGPSAFGRCKTYLDAVFPQWSSPIFESLSSMGLVFFVFLVGLELDLESIRRRSRKAFGIAAAGILLPFVSGVGVVFLLRRTASSSQDDTPFLTFLVFIGVALSITAFPVLARILAELKMLTTTVGETAMAAAAFNDLAAWALLALAISLSGGEGHHRNPFLSIWILLSGVSFVAFMMIAVRQVMAAVARRSSQENRAISEASIYLTLAGVLVSGFLTDFIGIHSIFGAFVFGLTIPKHGSFAGKLFERIEDFVTGLMLPLYFAASGLKTDIATIQGVQAWGALAVVTATACLGKLVGTFVVAVCSETPTRDAATLGVLMGTKGLVELIVLNIGREKKVLNDKTFAIMVLMALFSTFITTPAVAAIYRSKENRNSSFSQSPPSSSSTVKHRKNLKLMVCLQSPGNGTAAINVVDMIGGGGGRAEKERMKLYVLRLVELTERPSSIFTALRSRRKGWPARDMSRAEEDAMGTFRVYEKTSRAKVRAVTAISALATMHEDVCHVAEEKRVGLVIVPFMADAGPAWSQVCERVLARAPCSVGLLVGRGFAVSAQERRPTSVCVVCFGGPDDGEALEIGEVMMSNPRVRLSVKRFIEEDGSSLNQDEETEKKKDEETLEEFKRRSEGRAAYEETRVIEPKDIIQGVLLIGKSGEFDLVVIGRRPSSSMAESLLRGDHFSAENTELGVLRSILASQEHSIVCSFLVIQQHNGIHSPVLRTAPV